MSVGGRQPSVGSLTELGSLTGRTIYGVTTMTSSSSLR